MILVLAYAGLVWLLLLTLCLALGWGAKEGDRQIRLGREPRRPSEPIGSSQRSGTSPLDSSRPFTRRRVA